MSIQKFANVGGIRVEIMTAGHFPTTVMVKTPTGSSIEVNITDLEF